MPWHDIAVQLDGTAATDVAINFIQRWNHAMATSPATKDTVWLFPMSPEEEENSQLAKIDLGYPNCEVQILRSVCAWSAGVPETERSIQRGYISAIKNAKHFIYIGNIRQLRHTY